MNQCDRCCSRGVLFQHFTRQHLFLLTMLMSTLAHSSQPHQCDFGAETHCQLRCHIQWVCCSISFSCDRRISCAAHNSPSKKPHRKPITIRWAVNCVTFIPFTGSASFILFISLSFNFFFLYFLLTNVFACIEEIARYLLTSSTEPKKKKNHNCYTLIQKPNKKARNRKMAFSAGEAQSKYANDGSLSAKFKTQT